MKYLNSAIASDGGTTWLALEDEAGTLYELKLDKKIGSPTSGRLYVNESLLGTEEESRWIKLLQETATKSTFEHEGEREMIEHVISSLVNRN